MKKHILLLFTLLISVASLAQIQTINVGTTANDRTGDALRTAFQKTNSNFTYLESVKAALASPAFTGTPTAPTATGSTNSTQIATTAFVKNSAPKYFGAACSDLTTTLTAGTNKGFIPVPVGFTVTGVYAELLTAQSSGSVLTIDINEGGTSILSTKLTIDNSETTSNTSATPYVLSDTAIAVNGRLTIDIDQVGTGGAGLVVWIYGY